jgi:hypothetical protein
MGMSKSVHVLQRGAEVAEIVNMAAIALVDAQEKETRLEAETHREKRASTEQPVLELDEELDHYTL